MFGMGFFFGASSEVEMVDNLVRWESIDMISPIIKYTHDKCNGNNIGFRFNMLKSRVSEISYLGFPDIEEKVVS